MKLKVDEQPKINLRIENTDTITLNAEVQLVTDVPEYKGEYDIRPEVYEQTLQTQGKLMSSNVNVREIPRYTVSNDSGGNTVTIGGLNG